MDWQTLVSRWSADPFLFVLEALFKMREEDWKPWEPGTPRPSPLPKGPDRWQAKLLRDVAAAKRGETKRKFTVRAAHGVGKTTTEAWLVLYFVLFHRDLKVPVTANSQDQLRDVLWAEIAKWHRELPSFLRDMIEVTAERVTVKADPEGSFAVARTARPEKPEALQGFHAGTLAFFADEASGIEDVVYEVASGTLSSDDVWMFMFANPTRTTGYFHRSHHQNRDRWNVYHVPSHAAVRVSPNYAKDMAAEYGDASNVYRVRVLGEFPLSDDNSVISLGLVEAAIDRDVSPNEMAVVWGLDVARFGDDTTALAKRRGNVLTEPVREWKKIDLMQTVGNIMEEYSLTPLEKRPSAINVDVIGLGAGVVDRLRELGLPVRGVNVGEAAATSPERFMRLRDELWWKARDWFDSRAVTMPKDDALVAELVGPTYKLESSGKLKVEGKDDMKKRGIKSPNKADAFCLTFAGGDFSNAVVRRVTAVSDYDPFAVNSDDFERHVRRASSAGMEYRPF
jgi:phage terminase large subunit